MVSQLFRRKQVKKIIQDAEQGLASSEHLTSLLNQVGIHIPGFLSRSFLEIRNGHLQFQDLILQRQPISADILNMENLWNNAPHIGSIPLIVNVPALFITILITILVYVGI